MSDIELHVHQPARNRHVVITDAGPSYDLAPDDDIAVPAARRGQTDTAEHLAQTVAWLSEDAPDALVMVIGTIPPGHPLGVPATGPNGKPL